MNGDKELMVAGVKNPDKSIAIAVFNEGESEKHFTLSLNEQSVNIKISPQAIQTIMIPTN